MSQISAFVIKELKEFIRSPSMIFWVIAWPLFWLVLTIFVFLTGIPEEALGYAKGSVAIQTAAFAIGTVGMVTVSVGLATDRDRGLYEKLISMPVSPWSEVMGRLIGSVAVSAIGAAAVFGVGLLLGGEYEATKISVVKSLPFFITLILSAAGLGLIIANSLRRVQAVYALAVIALVAGAATAGIFQPYPFLPESLRVFSRIYPISASMHSIKYFLLPSEFKAQFGPPDSALTYDFNPGEGGFLAYTIISSLVLLMVGVAFHRLTERLRARRI